MTTETVLTDEQIEGLAWESRMENSRAEIPAHVGVFARAIEQAVLQSPEIQVLREALRAAAEYIGDRSAGSSRFWELYDAAMEKQS